MQTTRKIVLTLSAAAMGLGLGVVAPSGASAAPAATVRMHDDCDAATFNAAFGDGTCVGNGTTVLNDFLAQLQAKGRANGWSFRPSVLHLDKGDRIRAVDTGGEAHSFTRVAAFGGGCIDQLNQILGLTAVPECSQFVTVGGKRVPKFAATLVTPGGSRTGVAADEGTIRFECLIHPWMRTVVHVD
jgi:plastocyanin